MKEGINYKRLKDVAKYYNGLTYKPTDVTEEGVLVLRSSNIQDNKLSLFDQVRVSIKIDEKLKVHKGDLIMCSRNGSKSLIGKVAIIPEEFGELTFGTFMMIFKSEYNPFLYYFFLSDVFKKQIWKGEATMINQITRYMLDDVCLPVPPLPEQQRIVEYLDSQFAKIEALKANAAQQLQAAKDLFQSALKDLMTPKEGWEKKIITDVCDNYFAGGDAPKIKSKNRTEEYKYPIYSNGVENEGIYGYTNSYRVNDVAITIAARGTIGATFIRMEPFTPIVRLITLIPNPKIIIAKFLYYLVKNYDWGHTGASIPQLTIPALKDIIISFPTKEKQQQIVSQLDDLSNKIKALQSNYEQTITLCSDLKQSLLKQIFE